MLITTPVLFAAIGFALGRYTSAREPLYFIGARVDPVTNSIAGSAEGNNHHSIAGSESAARPQLVISPSEANAICGARTKSGKPCKRKVKGGGFCWQHHNGQSPKEATAER